MNFDIDFRNQELVNKLLDRIRKQTRKKIRIMEVCGGHTMAIRRYGIHNLLPNTIELLSGPGCPVCVTPVPYINHLIALSQQPDVIITTYGDLIRVPGSSSSLNKERAQGAKIQVIDSTLQALDLARNNLDKKIVFAGIGFETTTPATAIAVLQAQKEKLDNFFVLSAHKVMPPAMDALLEEGIPIDGYIGPGHVSAITGSKIFFPLAEHYGVPVVVSGFEPVDILESVLMLVERINANNPGVDIQYRRLVTVEGNHKAQKIVDTVFETSPQEWRGLGAIPDSGLHCRKAFVRYDAEKQIPVKAEQGKEPKGCICGLVLKGLKKPVECALFGHSCTPSNPVGACMVSSEGSCNASYSYK